MQMNHDITIQDVFHRFLPQYCETHNFSPQQQLTALCISKCHTLEMGANLSECENCHKKYIHYNSCKNRHCPMCQGMEVDEWIDKQQENVLDVPYFHTVFTVPEELYSQLTTGGREYQNRLPECFRAGREYCQYGVIQIRNSFMMLCTMQHIKQWKNCLRIRSILEQGLDISAYFILGAPG